MLTFVLAGNHLRKVPLEVRKRLKWTFGMLKLTLMKITNNLNEQTNNLMEHNK